MNWQILGFISLGALFYGSIMNRLNQILRILEKLDYAQSQDSIK